MEQDLGPASTLLAAREDSPRGASVRGSPVGVPRSRPAARLFAVRQLGLRIVGDQPRSLAGFRDRR